MMDFDVIPFEDIKGDWKKLGSGSFGNVYKGNYLGIEVAIKEVLPSTEYDVAKYFEREWRLMKEARHPNVVLYLGLSRAPPPSNTIYIISEFIPSGNLRTYLFNKSLPLPWRLRLSFATDIARALAYLHARNCIHRDLKGENLLVTSNGRLKITDFGFARIAARNLEESKRLTFCGTDSYMSPEIQIGQEFGLPTDIFSLGVIFCEIISRRLADDHTFKRSPPYYEIDATELRVLASPGAPMDFITLALECCSTNPAQRPTMLQVLDRLRAIELEVLNRPSEAESFHVGSVKLFTGVGSKGRARPGMGPRIPSFGEIRGKKEGEKRREPNSGDSSPREDGDTTPEETSEDEELMEAVEGPRVIPSEDSTDWSRMTARPNGHKRPFENANDSLPLQHEHVKAAQENGEGSTLSREPLLKGGQGSIAYTDYSTSVVKKSNNSPPSLSSIMTVRPKDATATTDNGAAEEPKKVEPEPISRSGFKSLTTDSHMSAASYHTAHDTTSSFITNPYASHIVDNGKQAYSVSTIGTIGTASIAAATEGGSTVRSEIIGGLHRFTLIKPGGTNTTKSMVGKGKSQASQRPSAQPSSHSSWSPFEFFFSSGFGFGGSAAKAAKCDLCGKRLGWKPCLECDDCGLRAHLKCGELAPRDCGLRGNSSGTGGIGLQRLTSNPLGKLKSGAKVR
ncbi:hypothetical protein FRC19_006544 [Serendipita sp. 401]|nr:hypothetical protein FRC16_005302 [Serendipita sp. 398]KAG8828446.1 hypothetical protein FRC19_006544 [Serendipita sp. 401]KAG9058078.1 hypothetical protein FS842_001659 [Serendipita sp. 407]